MLPQSKNRLTSIRTIEPSADIRLAKRLSIRRIGIMAALLATFFHFADSSAHAQYLPKWVKNTPFDPDTHRKTAEDLIPANPGGLSGRQTDVAIGRTHIPVYFRNNGPRPLIVAYAYQVKVNQSFGQYDPGYRIQYLMLQPLQTVRAPNNYGQSFRYYAESTDGRISWSGNDWIQVQGQHFQGDRNNLVPMIRVDMGDDWRRRESFTFNLNQR